MIFADLSSDLICLAEQGRVVVASTRGHRLSPVLHFPCDAATRCVVSATSGLVCFGEFESGIIEAIDVARGQTRWKLPSLRHLHRLHTYGSHILAESLDGSSLLLDGLDGKTIAKDARHRALACESAGGGMLVLRKKLEYTTGLANRPSAVFAVESPFHAAAFAPGAVIVAQPNGLVRRFEICTGQEQWRFDCGVGSLAGGLAWCEAIRAVFCIRFHRDQDHEPEALLLDGERGEVRQRAPTPDNISQPVIADRGKIALTSRWCCEIPALAWRSWDPSLFLAP